MQEHVAGRKRVPEHQFDRRHVADHDHRLPRIPGKRVWNDALDPGRYRVERLTAGRRDVW